MGVQGLLSAVLEELLVVWVPVSHVFPALVFPGAQRRRAEGNGVGSGYGIQREPGHPETPKDLQDFSGMAFVPT